MRGPVSQTSIGTTPPEEQSLLARLEDALRGRYLPFIVVLGIVLFAWLVLAAYAQRSDGPSVLVSLRVFGLDPMIIVYILMIHPVMRTRWARAMASLESLSPEMATPDRAKNLKTPYEWLALSLGALTGLAIARRLPAIDGWLWVYAEVTNALAFALLGSAIYSSFMRSRYLAARSRSGLALNVFDGHLLTPFAQWGQSLSLVFVGGICLSLLFQSYQSLRSIEGVLVYAILIVVALTLFFMSMRTVHVALLRAQETELAIARHDLAAAREALKVMRQLESVGTSHDAYMAVVVRSVYEQQVIAAPTWPFNPTIVGRVFASAIVPLGIYGLKLAFGMASG